MSKEASKAQSLFGLVVYLMVDPDILIEFRILVKRKPAVFGRGWGE